MTKFDKIINKSRKLAKHDFPSTHELFEDNVIKKMQHIIADDSHPLANQIVPSRLRSGRYVYLRTNRERGIDVVFCLWLSDWSLD